MVVCNFFLRGDCKFGDRCRFDHPRGRTGGDGGGGFHSYKGGTNYYSAGGDGYSHRGGGGTSYGHQQSNYNNPYVYRKDNDRGFNSHLSYNDRSQGRGGAGRPKTVTFKDSFGNFGSNQNQFAALDSSADQTSHFGQNTRSNDFDPHEILIAIKHDMEEWEDSKFWLLSSYKPSKSQGCVPGLEDISAEEVRFITYSADKENKFDHFKASFAAVIDLYNRKRNILKNPPSNVVSQLVGLYRGKPRTRSIFGDTESAVEMLYNYSSASSGSSQAFGSSGFASSLPGFDSTSTSSSAFSRSTFGSTTSGSSFGSQPLQDQSGSIAGAGLFGKSVTTADGGSGGITSNTGLFGKPVASTDSQQGMFGKAPSDSVINSRDSRASSATKTSIYTPLSELTPEEKEEFEAVNFTLGKVPMRPPPMELCR